MAALRVFWGWQELWEWIPKLMAGRRKTVGSEQLNLNSDVTLRFVSVCLCDFPLLHCLNMNKQMWANFTNHSPNQRTGSTLVFR